MSVLGLAAWATAARRMVPALVRMQLVRVALEKPVLQSCERRTMRSCTVHVSVGCWLPAETAAAKEGGRVRMVGIRVVVGRGASSLRRRLAEVFGGCRRAVAIWQGG